MECSHRTKQKVKIEVFHKVTREKSCKDCDLNIRYMKYYKLGEIKNYEARKITFG